MADLGQHFRSTNPYEPDSRRCVALQITSYRLHCSATDGIKDFALRNIPYTACPPTGMLQPGSAVLQLRTARAAATRLPGYPGPGGLNRTGAAKFEPCHDGAAPGALLGVLPQDRLRLNRTVRDGSSVTISEMSLVGAAR